MIHPTIKEEILARLDKLPFEQQRRVLDFAQALVVTLPKGVPGESLMRFAGVLDAKTLKEMEEAIEEGCEQIDKNEW